MAHHDPFSTRPKGKSCSGRWRCSMDAGNPMLAPVFRGEGEADGRLKAQWARQNRNRADASRPCRAASALPIDEKITAAPHRSRELTGGADARGLRR